MFNLTKLDLLWDWVGDLKKRIIPLEEKIPKDYSTTETATGQKWIDGKEIYCKIENGTLPVISSTGIYDILNYSNKNILYTNGFITSGTGNKTFLNAYTGAGPLTLIQKSSGELSIYSPAAYSENTYAFLIYYTKTEAPETREDDTKERYDTTPPPTETGTGSIVGGPYTDLYEPEPEEKKTTRKKGRA